MAAAITGYVDAGQYDHYLAAANFAIQFRTSSRGETSRAVLDCMAAGLPVIVNAHGTAVEIPPEAVVMLPDQVTVSHLTTVIDDLFEKPDRRGRAAENGLRHLRERHPHVVGSAVTEAFSIRGAAAQEGQILTGFRELYANVFPSEHDMQVASRIIAGQHTRIGRRQYAVV